MAATLNLTGAVPATTAAEFLVIEATAQLSSGIAQPPSSAFRPILKQLHPVVYPIAMLGAYQSKFGALLSGGVIHIRAYTINHVTGMKSLPYLTSITVA